MDRTKLKNALQNALNECGNYEVVELDWFHMEEQWDENTGSFAYVPTNSPASNMLAAAVRGPAVESKRRPAVIVPFSAEIAKDLESFPTLLTRIIFKAIKIESIGAAD